MKYLHTMVTVTDLDESLDFYCNKLGLVELRRGEKLSAGNVSLSYYICSKRGNNDRYFYI